MNDARLLVAVDLDGTLVQDNDDVVSPRVVRAVRGVSGLGHHVILATGRPPAAVYPVAHALGLSPVFAVCSNGSITLRITSSGAETLDARSFDPRPLIAILPVGCAYAIETADGQGFRHSDTFPCDELPSCVERLPIAGYERRASRILLHDYPGAEALGSDFGFTVTHDGPAVEFASAGTSKASALEELRVRLGVHPDNTVAVGNDVNDLDMIAWAARGFATSDAPLDVLALASRTIPSVADDGVAELLENGIGVQHESAPFQKVSLNDSRIAATEGRTVRQSHQKGRH